MELGRAPATTTKSAAPESSAVGIPGYKTLLRSAGLRSTAARLAVLEFFHQRGGQNSHADVFDALSGRGFDRATLYRILQDLVQVDILSRSDLGDRTWRFELQLGVGGAQHSEKHPHFVCVECGGVACVRGVSLRLSKDTNAPKSVAEKQVSVQLRGLCDKCS